MLLSDWDGSKENFVIEHLKTLVQYFRKENDKEMFHVKVKDIKLKLPASSVFVGAKRLSKQLKFPLSFDG